MPGISIPLLPENFPSLADAELLIPEPKPFASLMKLAGGNQRAYDDLKRLLIVVHRIAQEYRPDLTAQGIMDQVVQRSKVSGESSLAIANRAEIYARMNWPLPWEPGAFDIHQDVLRR